MGQGPSAQFVKETIQGDQYRAFCDVSERTVGKAFEKCVEPITAESEHDLSADEQTCVEEYTMLFTHFTKTSFAQYQSLYENHQREMYEKARMEQMQLQSRSDIKKMRGE